jgi:hypothetical protein
MIDSTVYLLFSIFLYIFKVYVTISHSQKMNLVVILSLLLFILNRDRNNDIISEVVANLFVTCMFLGVAYYLPNLIIGYLLALIFKRVTLYLNINYNLALIF